MKSSVRSAYESSCSLTVSSALWYGSDSALLLAPKAASNWFEVFCTDLRAKTAYVQQCTAPTLTHLCSHSRLALAGCVTRKALLALPTALQESQLPYSGWHPYMKPCCVYYFLSGSSGSRQTIVSKKTLSSHILGMSILLSIFFLRCQVSLGNCFLVGALTL